MGTNSSSGMNFMHSDHLTDANCFPGAQFLTTGVNQGQGRLGWEVEDASMQKPPFFNYFLLVSPKSQPFMMLSSESSQPLCQHYTFKNLLDRCQFWKT